MPRVQDGLAGYSRRKPFRNPWDSSDLVICYCKECDPDVERYLPLRLSEFCDCDQYTRWICVKCKVEEDKPSHEYCRRRTKGEYVYPTEGDDGVRVVGMWLPDHQQDLAVSLLKGYLSPSKV